MRFLALKPYGVAFSRCYAKQHFCFSVTSTIVLILRQSLLGPVIGWLAAKIAGFILQKIYNDALAEITVTLSFTYLVFYVGEAVRGLK